ncbi:SDR family oxidoreductase [Cohnella soli]|uniref:SDR family oxidoreductase n=1 Tax=Cohnella soli TaxID=425005 RepID=A0ABW0HYH6_9BACL
MDNVQLVALVTGANKGIGFEIARQLGKLGITVLIGARDQERGKEAERLLVKEGIDAQFIQVDVTDQPAVDDAAAAIREQFGKLDILVNNAGILVDEKPPSNYDIRSMRAVYETNVFGVFRTTKAMVPLLLASEQGRIVNLSSSLGSLTLNSDPNFELASFLMIGYNSSKAAVNALTVFYANDLRETAIKVNAADPGYCATALNGFTGLRTPEEGARTAVWLATLSSDGPTGGFFNDAGIVPW